MRGAFGTAAAIVLGFTVAWPILDFLFIRQKLADEADTSDDAETVEDFLNNGGSLTGTNGPDFLTGTAAAETLTGKGDPDILEGQGGDDTLDGGPDVDQLFGGSGADTFLFRDTPGTDYDRIQDATTDDIFGLVTSSNNTLIDPFTKLVDGEGSGLSPVADDAKVDASVGTGINVDETGPAVPIDPTSVDVLVFYDDASGTDGIADGLDGLIDALIDTTDTTVVKSDGTAFSANNQMVAVVENTTTSRIEVGLITDVNGNGFGDASDTVAMIFEIDANSLSAQQVASQIDFLGLA